MGLELVPYIDTACGYYWQKETPWVLKYQRDKGTKDKFINWHFGIWHFKIHISSVIKCQMPNAKMPMDGFVPCPFVRNRIHSERHCEYKLHRFMVDTTIVFCLADTKWVIKIEQNKQ